MGTQEETVDEVGAVGVIIMEDYWSVAGFLYSIKNSSEVRIGRNT